MCPGTGICPRSLRIFSTAEASKAAGVHLSVTGSGRSRPPLGAIQISWPPFLRIAVISFSVRVLALCFMSTSSGTSLMCFFEYTHNRFLPMLKGLQKGSRTTRSPAIYVCHTIYQNMENYYAHPKFPASCCMKPFNMIFFMVTISWKYEYQILSQIWMARLQRQGHHCWISFSLMVRK
jgi:hypothetical protein